MNGLLIQWGLKYAKESVTGLLFSNSSYILVLGGGNGTVYNYPINYTNKTKSSFSIISKSNITSGEEASWLAIGY